MIDLTRHIQDAGDQIAGTILAHGDKWMANLPQVYLELWIVVWKWNELGSPDFVVSEQAESSILKNPLPEGTRIKNRRVEHAAVAFSCAEGGEWILVARVAPGESIQIPGGGRLTMALDEIYMFYNWGNEIGTVRFTLEDHTTLGDLVPRGAMTRDRQTEDVTPTSEGTVVELNYKITLAVQSFFASDGSA